MVTHQNAQRVPHHPLPSSPTRWAHQPGHLPPHCGAASACISMGWGGCGQHLGLPQETSAACYRWMGWRGPGRGRCVGGQTSCNWTTPSTWNLRLPGYCGPWCWHGIPACVGTGLVPRALCCCPWFSEVGCMAMGGGAVGHRAQPFPQSTQGSKPRVGVWPGVKGQGTGTCEGRTHSSSLVSSGCQAQQLAVRLEPQGLLYAKLTLSEQQEAPDTAEPRVFGLPLPLLVEREQPPGQVPLIIQKCVGQIERRGLRVSPSPHPSWTPGLRPTSQDTPCTVARPFLPAPVPA